MKKSKAAVQKRWWSRGFTVNTQEDPAGKHWAQHTHPVDEIVRLVEGEIDVQVGGKIVKATAGQDVVVPKKTVHSIKNRGHKKATYYYGFRNKK